MIIYRGINCATCRRWTQAPRSLFVNLIGWLFVCPHCDREAG